LRLFAYFAVKKALKQLTAKCAKDAKGSRKELNQFDVFITTDKNLPYQQNLTGRGFATLLLPSNQVPIVEALLPSIDAALDSAQPGDFAEIPFPP